MTADRPPPARDRGPERPRSPRAERFVRRTRGIDRAERFRERLVSVRDGRVRAQRRDRALLLVGLGVAVVVAVAVGAMLAGAVGAIGGAGVVAVAWAIWIGLGRLAARRGASAWDWQAERHRLVGDPSRRVQHPPRGGPGLVGRADDDARDRR